MIKSGKRRGAKKKPKQTLCETDQNVDDKIGNQADISTYFLKLKNDPLVDNEPLQEVLIPCPDDATLPSSTCLGYNNVHEDGNTNITSEDGIKSAIMITSTVVTKHCKDTSKTLSNENDIVSKKKSKKQTGQLQNRQLTDFFPIRRSSRKPLCNLMKEKMKVVEDIVVTGKEEGFEIKEFPDKGRGVISAKAIKRGDFVLEYYGELIDPEEAKKRESVYALKENTGCYMYYFKYRNKSYCIDATQETNRLGRLINHSKKGNLKTQTFLVKDRPHLVFLASKDINEGDELLYDYGDRSKLALESHPWLAL